MPSLADALNARIQKDGLTLGAAAGKIGVSQPSLRSALAGSAKPNVRSLPKYAKFLGLSLEQVAELGGGAGKGGRKGRGRPAKAAAPARRGRPAKGGAKAGGDAKATVKAIKAKMKEINALLKAIK